MCKTLSSDEGGAGEIEVWVSEIYQMKGPESLRSRIRSERDRLGMWSLGECCVGLGGGVGFIRYCVIYGKV